MKIFPLGNQNLNRISSFLDGTKTENVALNAQIFSLKKRKKLEDWLQNLYSTMDEFPLKLEGQNNKKSLKTHTASGEEHVSTKRLVKQLGNSFYKKLLTSYKQKNPKFKTRRRRKRGNQIFQISQSATETNEKNLITTLFLSKVINTSVLKKKNFKISFLLFKKPVSLKQKKIYFDFHKKFESKISTKLPFFYFKKRPFLLHKLDFPQKSQHWVNNNVQKKNELIPVGNIDRYLSDFWKKGDEYEKTFNLLSINEKKQPPHSPIICVSTRLPFLKLSSIPKKRTVSLPIKGRVSFPNRFRFSKNWDLQVKIQDPFPSWFPKWLHWIKYLGIRRKRTPISMDDLIPQKVYQKYAFPFENEFSKPLKKAGNEVSNHFQLKQKTIFSTKIFNQKILNFQNKKRKDHIKKFAILAFQKKQFIYTLTDIRTPPLQNPLSILAKKASFKYFQDKSQENYPVYTKWTSKKHLVVLTDPTFQINTTKNQTKQEKKKEKEDLEKKKVKITKNVVIKLTRLFFSDYFKMHAGFLENMFVQSSERVYPFFQLTTSFPQNSIETILVLRENLYSPRLMSGYEYPDMELDEIKPLFLKFFYKNLKKKIVKFRWNQNIEEIYKKQNFILHSPKRFSSFFSSMSHGFFEKPFDFVVSLKLFEDNNFLSTSFSFFPIHHKFTQKKTFQNFTKITNSRTPFSHSFSSQKKTRPEKQVQIALPPNFLKIGYWFMPNVSKPFFNVALKQSFLSKFKLLDNELLSSSSALQNNASLFYKKEDILPFSYLQAEEFFIKNEKKSKKEIKKKLEQHFTPKERQILKDFKQVYSAVSAVPAKSLQHLKIKKQDKMKKWIEETLSQDNHLNDVKIILVDTNLRKKILKHQNILDQQKLAQSEHNNGDKSNVKTSLPQSLTPKTSAIQSLSRGSKGKTQHIARPHKESQRSEIYKVGLWKLPRKWKSVHWFPTLDCDRKERVVFLSEEFWTHFLSTKKNFLDSTFTEILKNLEKELQKKKM